MCASSELTDVLKEVIREMVEGKDVAVAFSGGLDCGIVASIAKDYANSIHLYTAGVDDAYDVNESREVSEILDLEWDHIRISEDDIEDNVRDDLDNRDCQSDHAIVRDPFVLRIEECS